ncbi:MAG TPA: hypothetical protein GXX77_04390 [Candidatus Cloacimonetes bacterium]|nr:hypothetical protein [Candidatus Cloacimonadota bacterium]
MKFTQTIIMTVLALLVIVFGVVWMNASKANKALRLEKEELESLYESSSAMIADVQANLDEMEQDLSGQLFTQSELSETDSTDRRDKMVASIAIMREQIEADKKKIAQLEAQLANSRTQLRGVQETVDRLKASLADKEQIMSELQERMGILDETIEEERRRSQREIAEIEQTVLEKEQEIGEIMRSENQIYYTVGTRKQLLDNKVINRKGGLLGIGRVTMVKKTIDAMNFSELNLLDQTEIRFPVTKKGYSILSNHIATTYTVEKDGDEYVLTITDPDNFRKQKFLVIELL